MTFSIGHYSSPCFVPINMGLLVDPYTEVQKSMSMMKMAITVKENANTKV